MDDTLDEFIRLVDLGTQDSFLKHRMVRLLEVEWMEVLHRRPDLVGAAVNNKFVPVNVLESILNDCSTELRLRISMRNVIAKSSSIIEKLVHDPSPRVRASMAAKGKLCDDYLRYLARDSDEGVRRMAEITLSRKNAAPRSM